MYFEKIINNKTQFLESFKSIRRNLENGRGNDFYDKLENEDYVLLFFNKDFEKLKEFLTKIIRFLSETPITVDDLDKFIREIAQNYINTTFVDEWADHFANILLLENESVLAFIIEFLVMDILNLKGLIDSRNYKFFLSGIQRFESVSTSKLLTVVKINIEDVPVEFHKEIQVLNDKDKETDYFSLEKINNFIYVIFDDKILTESGTKSISLMINTKNIIFETDEIILEDIE